MGRTSQRSSLCNALCMLAAGCWPVAAVAQALPAEPPSLRPDIVTPAPAPAENAPVAELPPTLAEDAAPAPTDERTLLKEQLAAELPDFADRVQLTAAEAEQLIDLFAERRFIERLEGIWPRSFFIGRSLSADLERRQAKIEALLGERVDTYLEYMESLPLRRRVLYLNAELGPEDRLSAPEQEQLIAVLLGVERSQAPRRSDWFALLPIEAEPAELAAKRFNAEREQYDFLRLRELTRLQLDSAEALLGPRQFDVLFHIEAERLVAARNRVETLRTAAGLAARIPE